MKKKVPKLKTKKSKPAFILIGLSTIAVVVVFVGIFQLQYPGLSFWEGIQNFANPSIKAVKIDPGMRREEVADRFAKAFGWTELEKNEFVRIHTLANNNIPEGYYFPSTYILPLHVSPYEASQKIVEKFNEKILNNQSKLKNSVINLDTAIKIASIIEREAGSKQDMRIISGVIWNRVFQGMALEMDATLQYAKATPEKWWPRVASEDKYLKSPYNTYKNKGFPPTAISNPSEDAIWAALNPAKTDTIFYIHDDNGNIHTARTYSEHLYNINRYF